MVCLRSLMRYIKNIYIYNSKNRFCSLAQTRNSVSNAKLQIRRKDEGVSYNGAYFDETDYYFENGLRKVYPYNFTHEASCKNRWIGRSLIDLFANEFHGFVMETFSQRLKNGQILVNGVKVGPEYILTNGDFITSVIHRHEQPVLAVPIKIIDNNDHFMVVEKPCSIPVHPTGAYRHNTLIFILAKEYGIKGLHTNHRLDRLTSGLLIFAKTPDKCREFQVEMASQQVKKTYVCRVDGEFPDGEIICDESIKPIYCQNTFCMVDEKGKKCLTKFQRLNYNGKSSVVLCQPLTGRMHQIRVHLQYIGYPIIGDNLYNNDVFGPEKGKQGDIRQPLDNLIEKVMEDRLSYMRPASSPHDVLEPHSDEFIQNINSKFSDSLMLKNKRDPKRFMFHSDCHYCCNLYKDPMKKNLIMYLHALKYEGNGWGFQSDMPEWASADWKEC